MECPRCKFSVAAESRFCANCGALLAEAAQDAPTRSDAAVIAPLLHSGAPNKSLRDLYFELGLKLIDGGRASEALASLEKAQKEPGETPREAELLLALWQAARMGDRADQSIRYLLEAALVDEPPRRDVAVGYALKELNANAATSVGRWLIEDWRPQHSRLAVSPAEIVRANLLAARTQLFLANFEEAIELVSEAAAGDAQLARREAAAMLAPETLPPSLSASGSDGQIVVARIWRVLGDFEQALAAVERALAIVSGPNYPDAPLYQLRGELLEQLGRLDAAARALQQAGDRYRWRREPLQAIPLIERSLALGAEHAGASWELADALLAASYEKQPTRDERVELLKRARDAWNRTYASRRPDGWNAWAYATGAFIAAREADLGLRQEGVEARWEAAALIERALLLSPEEALRWGNLSEFHRRLTNEETALAAALRGHQLDPQLSDVLSNLVIIKTNLGFWDDASAELVKLEALNKTPWTSFVASRLHLYCGRPAEALARIDEALRVEPDDLTYLHTSGLALRKLRRLDDSRKIAKKIVRDRFDLEDRENLGILGWAALECGELRLAVQAFEANLSNSVGPDECEGGQRYLALALLANNEPDRALDLFAAGTKGVIDAELRWLLHNDMNDLESFAELWPGRDAISSALGEFRRRLETSPGSAPSTSRSELETAQAQAAGSPWQVVATLAGLARLDGEQREYTSAAERYTELEERWSTQFPEAPLGVEAALDGLRESTSVADYWAMRDQTPQGSAWRQRFYETYLESRFKMSADAADSAKALPIATPIAVEMDSSLLPQGDFEQWPIVKAYLPKMRAAIEQDTGVKVPGIRLRANEYGGLAPNRFMIILADVPLLEARVVHGAAYCVTDASRVEALGATVVDRETDPMEYVPACWIKEEQCAQVRAAGVEVLTDHHQYIARQLEAVLRKNLADFLGIDEVIALLKSWREKSGRPEQIDRLEGDDKQLPGLTRLMRRLLRERAPVTDGDAILDVVAESGSPDAPETLRAVRLRLRERFAATASPERWIRLPPEIERKCLNWLHERDGKTFLAMPWSDAEDVLGVIRGLVSERTAPAMVVESPRLRPHARNLVELEFPDVAVFAAEELAGEQVSGTAPR